jgi:hypothetical protein
MNKENTVSIKTPKIFRDFLDNARCTRRSKVVGADSKLLTIPETCDLLVRFFQSIPESYQLLIKFNPKTNDR